MPFVHHSLFFCSTGQISQAQMGTHYWWGHLHRYRTCQLLAAPTHYEPYSKGRHDEASETIITPSENRILSSMPHHPSVFIFNASHATEWWRKVSGAQVTGSEIWHMNFINRQPIGLLRLTPDGQLYQRENKIRFFLHCLMKLLAIICLCLLKRNHKYIKDEYFKFLFIKDFFPTIKRNPKLISELNVISRKLSRVIEWCS